MSEIRHLPVAPTHTLAMRAGETVERHQHDDHQLIYVSSGVVAIRTEHGTWVASSDRGLWVPAHTWHEHRFYGRSSFHTIGFAEREPVLPVAAPSVVAVDALVRELVIALTEDGVPAGEARRLRGVLADRLRRASLGPVSLPTPVDPRLADACRLVTADLATPRGLDWLAARVGASERTLSRLFRAEFGMTYPQWRERTRLVNAMILLAEGNSVTETAHASGWATASAFVAAFRRALGTTPGSHRPRPRGAEADRSVRRPVP
jgi:AraC-like DNA-binding protein